MDDKQVALIESLVKRSEQGRVDWRKTADPELFLATIGNYIVSVTREVDDWSNFVYVIEISNSDDETVERISSETMSESMRTIGGAPVDRRIGRLHELARRRAHGAEQAIDAILGELDSVP